jgi:hypothetical protein
MKDPAEIRLPGGDRFLVALRAEKSRDRAPFTLLDDIPLDLRQRAIIEGIVDEADRTDHCWFHSRRQLVNRFAY